MTLRTVDPRSAYADSCRSDLNSQVNACCDLHGDDIAGYALIVWDRRGGCRTALWTHEGPVSMALAPTYVGDALNRHVAVMLSQTETVETSDA